MAITAELGTGLTITHAGFAFGIIGVNIDGVSWPVIDATRMSDTSYRRKIFGALADLGGVSVECEWDGTLPEGGVAKTTTITFNGGTVMAGDAAITDVSGVAPLEDKMTGTVVFTWNGENFSVS
jgi:hypothetical protein